MGMNEIITAEAAREIAANTTKPLRRIMKEINRACEDGLTHLNWDIYGMSVTQVRIIKEKLVKLGYKVEIVSGVGLNLSDKEILEKEKKPGSGRSFYSLDVFWE